MQVIRRKPVTEQVDAILRERILEGVYSSGQRIPSENKLSDEFGVSRATIRTVLAKLAVEGLILRKQGDGTYINERIQEENTYLGHIWDFWQLIERNGYKASITALSIDEKKASKEDARLLAIDPGDSLVLMKRLFCADGQPVILAENLMPVSFLALPIETLNGQLRIREMMQQYCHQEIAFAITEIASTIVSEEIGELFQREDKNPFLVLKIAFYSGKNQPLVIGTSYFDDSKLRLRLIQAWH